MSGSKDELSDFESEGLFNLLGYYKNHCREQHEKTAAEYFDSLVEKAGVDIEKNRETNRLLREKQGRAKKIGSRIAKRTAVKVLLVIVALVCGFVAGAQVAAMSKNGADLVPVLVAIGGVGLCVLFFFLFSRMIPKTRVLKQEKAGLEGEIAELSREVLAQMEPLNRLFTPEICPVLFKKTLPYINLDRIFDSKRLDFFVRNFGLDEARDEDIDRSTLFVKSGDIKGNPFFICTDLVHEMGTKVYTGSITIHWTTRRYSDGKWHTEHHTQVLTASVEKPCPYYSKETYLVYGNEAAPDLIFSRRDSDAERMSERQIEKYVDRRIKKLKKQSEKSVSKGEGITVLGNSEFEVLFGATDRNNEVQFRLLFTPLAQKQLLELMKDKEVGYGDDFGYVKYKKLNFIYPNHLNRFQLDIDAKYFHGHDIDEVKRRFVEYNSEYFKQLYFSFAPVLAIPLYQQQQPHEFIYKELYESFASFYEHEYVANNLGESFFAHPKSATPSILKTDVVSSDGKSDTVRVTALGYHTEKRVDYVQKMGGDGKLHTIPVEWLEYIPVTNERNIAVFLQKEVEEPSTYTEKIRQLVESLKESKGWKNINEKDVFRVGNFLACLIRE